MAVLGLLQLKIYSDVNRTGRDVSAIKQLNFFGLLSKSSPLPTSMSMCYSLFLRWEARYDCNMNLCTTSLLFLSIFCGLLSNRPPTTRVSRSLGQKEVIWVKIQSSSLLSNQATDLV